MNHSPLTPAQLVRLRNQARLPWSAWLTWLMWPMLAFAAIVTAADVANAIRNSPTASAFLRAHADEIGALAIRVESGGDTTAYNGSCCYGVLQLNTSNIIAAGYSVAQYRYGSLQEQVNAWSTIQTQALNDPVIQRLQNMGTFDGQPVDAMLLISCVQLGQGNCRTMINSGRCNGFEDANGTDICEMAAKTRAVISGTGTPGGSPEAGTGGGPTAGGGSYVPAAGAGAAPDEAFEQGSTLAMNNVSQSIKLVVAGLALLWLAWVASGTWARFTNGRLTLPDMTRTLGRATVVVLMVIWLLN